jgi:predicted MFS family arabinose efflux permease
VQESRDPAPRRIDWPGQATLAGGLFLLVLALLRGNEDGWTSTPIVAELTGAVVLLAAFVAIQARVKEPMLPLGLFRSGDFTGAQISAFAISASLFAVFLYVTLYLQQILGLSAVEAGLVYLPGTMLNLIAAGMTANLLDRVSARVLIGVGLSLVAIGQAAWCSSSRSTRPGGCSCPASWSR